MNPEIVFIYVSSNDLPAHAAVKNVDGPWSKTRMGLCGKEVYGSGPASWCKRPGQVCQVCRAQVEELDGVWRTKEPIQNPDDVLRRRAAMLFGAESVAKADQFTTLVGNALEECRVPIEDRGGYLIGWLYGQLRKQMSSQQVRAVIEHAISMCEEKISVIERHGR